MGDGRTQRAQEDPRACGYCKGEGRIIYNPGYPDPQTETDDRCPDCHGTGLASRPRAGGPRGGGDPPSQA